MKLYYKFCQFPAVLDFISVGTFTMCHEALKNLKKGAPGWSDSSGGGLVLSSMLFYIIKLLGIKSLS